MDELRQFEMIEQEVYQIMDHGNKRSDNQSSGQSRKNTHGALHHMSSIPTTKSSEKYYVQNELPAQHYQVHKKVVNIDLDKLRAQQQKQLSHQLSHSDN